MIRWSMWLLLVSKIYKTLNNDGECKIIMDADPNNKTNNKLRTLVLSTNVNDYDTGEPILEGSIRKTMTKNKIL